MKTEHKLACALKDMMSEQPIDEISVLALTKKCNINRQTFYYHYHDIYDLLAQVYLNETIEDIDKARSFASMVEYLFKYYEKNKSFILATLDSAGYILCMQFFYNQFYKEIMAHLDRLESANALNINQKKNIATFYGSGMTYSFVRYIKTSKKQSYEAYMKAFNFIDGKEIADAVKYALTK